MAAATTGKAVLSFASEYTNAINNHDQKKLLALFYPASLACYQKSKYQNAYQKEFNVWFGFRIMGINELRKFNANFNFEFYTLMRYPENPTHILVFNTDGMVGSSSGRGISSVDLVEKSGKYWLLYRCM